MDNNEFDELLRIAENAPKVKSEIEKEIEADKDKPILSTKWNLGSAEFIARNRMARVVDVRGSDDKAQIITVILHISPKAGDTLNLKRGLARVTWGSAGLSCDAEVDFVNGTAFTVPASSMHVDAFNESPADENSFLMGAFAGYFPISNPIPPQRTRYLDVPLLAGNTTDFSVPNFAASLKIERFPSSASFVAHFFGNDAGGQQEVYTQRVGINNDSSRMPLSNDIRMIRLEAVDNITRARLIFGLRL